MDSIFEREKTIVIDFYLTPLAIILVLMAIIFSQPLGWSLYGSLILLVVSIIMSGLLAGIYSE